MLLISRHLAIPDAEIEFQAVRAQDTVTAGPHRSVVALDILRGKHSASPHVLIRETPFLVARCRIPSAAQVDGDYLGPLPVRFAVTDVPLRLVVPQGFPEPPG